MTDGINHILNGLLRHHSEEKNSAVEPPKGTCANQIRNCVR